MLLHERLLQNTFKWLFFPHYSLSAPCFFLLLCKGILTHCAAHLGAVNTETGFERRRRRGKPREPVRRARCAYRAGPTLPSILQRDFTTFQEMYFPPCLKSINSGRSLRLTVSQEEDEILCDLLIESLYGQRVLQGPLGPVIPKLGIFFCLCAWRQSRQTLLVKMQDAAWSAPILICSHVAARE